MADGLTTKLFYKREKLSIRVEYDDTRLTFCGQDFGGWAGTSEYEYWISVDAAALRAALHGTAGTDLGDLVCAHVDDIMATGETAWLQKHRVDYTVDTRYDYAD